MGNALALGRRPPCGRVCLAILLIALADAASALTLGLLCWSGPHAQGIAKPSHREACDHVHFAVAMINDKSDGFLDDLLPSDTIEVVEVDDTQTGALTAFQAIQASANVSNLPVVIGSWLSGGVKELANPTARASTTGRTVFVSPSSTLGGLSDRTQFPNVVRLTPNDNVHSKMRSVLLGKLEWSRVAIVYETGTVNSPWAVGVAEVHGLESSNLGRLDVSPASGSLFAQRNADGSAGETDTQIANGWAMSGVDCGKTTGEYSTAVHPGASLARQLLDELQAVNARIVLLALSPTCAHHLYHEAASKWPAQTYPHAFITSWPSDDSMSSPEGKVLYNAFVGAEGTMAFQAHDGSEESGCGAPCSSLRSRYISKWGDVASIAACTGVDLDGKTHCDLDGNKSTIASYGGSAIDAVLVYARCALASLATTRSMSIAPVLALERAATLVLSGLADIQRLFEPCRAHAMPVRPMRSSERAAQASTTLTLSLRRCLR